MQADLPPAEFRNILEGHSAREEPVANASDGDGEAGGDNVSTGKRTLRRARSFAERNVLITPENIDDVLVDGEEGEQERMVEKAGVGENGELVGEVEQPTPRRSISGSQVYATSPTESSPLAARPKGLAPLKRRKKSKGSGRRRPRAEGSDGDITADDAADIPDAPEDAITALPSRINTSLSPDTNGLVGASPTSPHRHRSLGRRSNSMQRDTSPRRSTSIRSARSGHGEDIVYSPVDEVDSVPEASTLAAVKHAEMMAEQAVLGMQEGAETGVGGDMKVEEMAVAAVEEDDGGVSDAYSDEGSGVSDSDGELSETEDAIPAARRLRGSEKWRASEVPDRDDDDDDLIGDEVPYTPTPMGPDAIPSHNSSIINIPPAVNRDSFPAKSPSLNSAASAPIASPKIAKEKTPWTWLSNLIPMIKPSKKDKSDLSSTISAPQPRSSDENQPDWEDPYPSDRHRLDGHPRYPLNVEKAVYRLSHVKLAQPRRPLAEQVAISNLMLYILSVHADVTLNRQGPRGRKKKGKKKRTGKKAAAAAAGGLVAGGNGEEDGGPRRPGKKNGGGGGEEGKGNGFSKASLMPKAPLVPPMPAPASLGPSAVVASLRLAAPPASVAQPSRTPSPPVTPKDDKVNAFESERLKGRASKAISLFYGGGVDPEADAEAERDEDDDDVPLGIIQERARSVKSGASSVRSADGGR
ncbi:hypothetical protein HK101_003155 [Irineochytrium annulatum]|nr:hypothetical protein HK101_003155 [Irineochytrium annulatum]